MIQTMYVSVAEEPEKKLATGRNIQMKKRKLLLRKPASEEMYQAKLLRVIFLGSMLEIDDGIISFYFAYTQWAP